MLKIDTEFQKHIPAMRPEEKRGLEESLKLEGAVSKFIAVTYGHTEHFNKSATTANKLKSSIGYMYGYLAAYEYRVRTGTLPPKLAEP